MSDPVIIFSNVSKSYPLYHHITAGIKNFLFHLPKAVSQMKNSRFQALKDISFEVYKGETFGIIGRNGAGKSTMLGLIAGVLKPSKGRVIVKGRILSLLELGAGFHPELAGRENIMLNGVLLGLTRAEVLKKMDEIIEFSDLDEFIDQPIRTYSSGMLARLGFSVASSLDPEILLIDEILAVGDENFQKKCLIKIEEVKKQGKTIVYVSHDLDSVERICERILLLDSGNLVSEGKPLDVISEYHKVLITKTGEKLGIEKEEPSASEQKYTKFDKRGEIFKRPLEDSHNLKKNRWGTREAEITKVTFLDKNNLQSNVFKTGEQIKVRIDYIAHAKIENPVFGIAIRRDDGIHIAGPNTKTSGYLIDNIEGKGFIEYIIDHIPLLKGTFFFTAAIYDFRCLTPYDHWEQNWSFHVIGSEKVGDRIGLISIPCIWRLHG